MFEVATHLALLLVLAAFCAGLIDSIAGGGGLISVPALLLAGASPVEALATNKLQGTFGAGTAMLNVSACAAGIASHTPVSLNSCGRMSSTANVSTGSENTSTYDSAVFSVA